jgi:hypothetical protein
VPAAERDAAPAVPARQGSAEDRQVEGHLVGAGDAGAQAARAEDRGTLTAFVDRLGLALIAPRRAFAISDELRGKGGLSDAFVLLCAKVVCLELPSLVRAVWAMLVNGVGAGVAGIGMAIQDAAGVDLILLLASGLIITIGAGKRRAAGRDFDLAAVAWTPYLAIDVLARLAVAVTGVHPPRSVTDALGIVAYGTLLVFVALAVRHARQRAA